MPTQQTHKERLSHSVSSQHPDAIVELMNQLERALPEARVTVDRPRDTCGEWFVDVAAGEFRAPIAWREHLGFGLFTATAGYGDRPNEVFKKTAVTVARLMQMHQEWEMSRSIHPVSLGQLRQLTGMQQADIAEALSLNQPAISRFEKRDDVKISTLTAYLEAMGGRLDIKAHFDDLGISVDLHAYVQSR